MTGARTDLTPPAPKPKGLKPLAQWGRGLWIVVVGLYFLLPLAAMAAYSLWAGGSHYDFSAYAKVIGDPQFRTTFGLSFGLALETIVIVLVLVIPAAFWVNLRLPGLRGLLNQLSVLAFVVPPIVLVGGLTTLYKGPAFFVGTPQFLVAGYVVLALPYSYRTIDTGLRALDLHTLSEAGQSLGAGWNTLLWRVVLPNLRGAVLGAALLTLAVVMGEFTFANVLLFNTFAVYINYVGQTQGTPAAALSLLSLALTWLAMLALLRVGRGRVSLGGGH